MKPIKASSLLMRILLAAALVLAASSAFASSHKNPLSDANRKLSAGDYPGAIKDLNRAYSDQPYVRDYILYHTAEARLSMGESRKANAHIEELLKKYPGSPIRQKARKMQAGIILSGDWDKAVPDIESYLAEYPSDDETRLSLAERLVMRGRQAEADPHLKKLYISAGPLSEKAFSLLSQRELAQDESFEHASRLYSLRKHELAEPLLKQLLTSTVQNSPNQINQQINLTQLNRLRLVDMLGHALFNQKKYDECPPYLEEAGDYYDAARAYLRSENLQMFKQTVQAMLERRDKDTPKLLYSLGEEARRKGDFKEALSQFDRAIANFPDDSEDARWGKAWLYYTASYFEGAAAEFDALASRSQDGRYLYWKARSLEMMGKDASAALAAVKPEGYYGLLARLRSKLPIVPLQVPAPPDRQNRVLRRAEMLTSSGFFDDAGIELQAAALRTKNLSDLVDISLLFIRAGKYNEAVKILNRVPGPMRPEDAAYPLAFWNSVTEASLSHGLDPFLLLSLMKEESQFATDALSPVGAVGLMQLMPATAAQAARQIGLDFNGGAMLNTPEANIKLGARFYGELFREFEHVPASLAAYNAGRTPVRKWLARGYSSPDEFVEDIPYKETREYVKRILSTYHRYLSGRGQAQSPALSKIL